MHLQMLLAFLFVITTTSLIDAHIDEMNEEYQAAPQERSQDLDPNSAFTTEIGISESISTTKEKTHFLTSIRQKLSYGNEKYCSGAVISKRLVISLNTCITTQPLGSIEMIVGIKNNQNNYDIKQIIVNDSIALFKTYKNIENSRMVRLPAMAKLGKRLRVYAVLGYAYKHGLTRRVKLEKCVSQVKSIKPNERCFKNVICEATIGSPIVARGRTTKIVGIFSQRNNETTTCNRKDISFAVDVYSYKDWIQSRIDANNEDGIL